MTNLSRSARTLLRQHLTENFSQAELEELAFDLGLDAETLLRETKSEFARALILHFEDRGDIGRLEREVLARRPDPALEQDLKNIGAQVAAIPPVAPVSTPQPQRTTSNVWLANPAVLAIAAIAAIAVVFALLALRQPSGSNPSPTAPASAVTAAPAEIASDVPGTPLALNETVRSGVDDQLKRRDVWRVALRAMTPYTIEIRSNVQDGVALGLLRPSASRAPDTVETADINMCSYAANCREPFTPVETGDYYVVVYGMRPSAIYDLTVRDR
jgi:hypothetical protein